jgi:hypothetical protein
MKYLITIIAAIIFAGFAFVKGYSVGYHEADGIVYPCAPNSILTATNPDARYSHCRDKDWDGSTLLRDRLAEAQERPDVYAILLESNSIHRLAMPLEMSTEGNSDPEPQTPTPTPKPSSAHRGSL